MLQLRKAEERRRAGAERELDRAKALLDLVLGLLLGHLLGIQVGVRPGVRADGVSGRQDLPQNFRMIGRVLADREKQRLGAFVIERFEHGRRIARPRTVVEGQDDLLVGEEIDLLEMLEEGWNFTSWSPVYRLAERFGVSGTMMKIRLEKLHVMELGSDGRPRPCPPVAQTGLFN